MATETVLDRFVTLFNFRTDTRGLNRLESKMGAVSSSIRNLTAGIVGVGAAFASSQVVQKAAAWDDAVNRLTGVSFDAPAHAVEKFEQQALSLSETWGRSATEIISLQEELKRSGLGWEDVMTLTPTVLQLAIGNNLDYARSAEIVVQALNAYGRSAEDAIQVSDQLALAAAQLFPTTLAQMAPAVRVVAGLASSMNIPFERLISLIGLLRKSMPAEMAGTGLRAVLIEMQKDKTAGESGDVIKQLGLDWANLQKVVAKGDIEHALRMLRDANLTAAQAVSLFGAEGANAAIQMIKLVDEVSASETALINAGGTTRKAAEAMETGVKDSLENMAAAWERLVIYLGESGLGEALEGLSDIVVPMMDKFKELPEWMQDVISWTAILVPSLTGLGAVFRVVGLSLGTIISGGAAVLRFLRVLPAATAAAGLGGAAGAAGGGAAGAAGGGAAGPAATVPKGGLLGMAGKATGWLLGSPAGLVTGGALMVGGAALLSKRAADRTGGTGIGWRAAAQQAHAEGLLEGGGRLGSSYLDAAGLATVEKELVSALTIAGTTAGEGLTSSLAQQIAAGSTTVDAAVDEMTGKIRDRLPGSDAKVGPLSDLTASGRAFSTTFAAGIAAQSGAVSDAIGRLVRVPDGTDLTASGRALGETFTAGVESSSQAIHDALSAALTLPVAPPPSAAGTGGLGAAAGVGLSVGALNVSVGDIRVESGDPEVIAADVGDALGTQLRRVVEEFDTPRLA